MQGYRLNLSPSGCDVLPVCLRESDRAGRSEATVKPFRNDPTLPRTRAGLGREAEQRTPRTLRDIFLNIRRDLPT